MVIKMTITKSLIAKFLHKRILYINNKLSCCVGYSPAEKKIRIEELQKLLKIVESTPETNGVLVAELNLSELMNVCRQNEKQYDAVVKQNRQLQTQMNAYKQALTDIQAIAGKSKNYSSTAMKIFERCNEVLCQANGVQSANK